MASLTAKSCATHIPLMSQSLGYRGSLPVPLVSRLVIYFSSSPMTLSSPQPNVKAIRAALKDKPKIRDIRRAAVGAEIDMRSPWHVIRQNIEWKDPLSSNLEHYPQCTRCEFLDLAE